MISRILIEHGSDNIEDPKGLKGAGWLFHRNSFNRSNDSASLQGALNVLRSAHSSAMMLRRIDFAQRFKRKERRVYLENTFALRTRPPRQRS